MVSVVTHIEEVNMRLREQLRDRITTHHDDRLEQAQEQARQAEASRYRKRQATERNDGVARKVKVGRRTFPSITAACRELGVGTTKLYAMLDNGHALYA
jgi:hypothetical protein